MAIVAAVYAKVALGPLQETLRSAMGLSDNQIALLQGTALALPMLVAAVPLGLVIDRYSRVRLLFILMILILAGSLLTALASHFAVLFAARSVVGLAAFVMGPTAGSLLADLYAPAERGRANMAINVGAYVGIAAVFALGGALLEKSGVGPGAWRTTMLWLTGPLVIVAALMLALHEPSRTERGMENPTARASLVELWSYRAVLGPLLVGVVMAEITLQSVMIWAAPTLSRTFSLAPARVGAILAIILPVGGIVGTIAGGIVADLCQRAGGPRRTFSVASMLALLCVPMGLFAVMPTVTATSALIVLLIAIVTTICAMGMTALLIVVPNELRGLCGTVLAGGAAVLAIGVAPSLVSLLSGAIGGPAMIGKSLALVCAVASLLGAATFALGRRSIASEAAL